MPEFFIIFSILKLSVCLRPYFCEPKMLVEILSIHRQIIVLYIGCQVGLFFYIDIYSPVNLHNSAFCRILLIFLYFSLFFKDFQALEIFYTSLVDDFERNHQHDECSYQKFRFFKYQYRWIRNFVSKGKDLKI